MTEEQINKINEGVRFSDDRMSELMATAIEQVMAVNEAALKNNLSAMAKAQAMLAPTIKEYNGYARKKAYYLLWRDRTPMEVMVAAVKQAVYPCIRVVDQKGNPDDLIPTQDIVASEKRIDLLQLDDFCKGIGKDTQWRYQAEKLQMLYVAKTLHDVQGIGGTVPDKYHLSRRAADIDMGKIPVSKTELLESTTMVLQSMVGIKATSKDVAFLLHGLEQFNRKNGSLRTVKFNVFVEELAEAARHAVLASEGTFLVYDVEYAKEKKKEKEAARSILSTAPTMDKDPAKPTQNPAESQKPAESEKPKKARKPRTKKSAESQKQESPVPAESQNPAESEKKEESVNK